MDYKAKSAELRGLISELRLLNTLNHQNIFSQRINHNYQIIRNQYPNLSLLTDERIKRKWQELMSEYEFQAWFSHTENPYYEGKIEKQGVLDHLTHSYYL